MLHYRHKNFYAPVTPSSRDWRQRKQIINKGTDTTAIMLYSFKEKTGHEKPNDKSTNKNKKYKLRDNTHPLSPHPHPDKNQPPTTYPIAPSFIITIDWTQNSW